MTMRLDLLSGPLAGMHVEARGELTVGRGPGNSLLLDDLKVSRHHATLLSERGRLTIVDAGSRNGTWVNDERIREERALRDGDRVRIGGSEMRVVAGRAAEAVPEALAADAAGGSWGGVTVADRRALPGAERE